ncbi:hypothetical protein T08_8247 [Trichinella sp. T8]|nr:hypothetical protein T08_8247 [Trichinella sp. T8]
MKNLNTTCQISDCPRLWKCHKNEHNPHNEHITIRQPPLQKAHFQVAKSLTLSEVANVQSRIVVGGVFSIFCDSIVRMKSRA